MWQHKPAAFYQTKIHFPISSRHKQTLLSPGHVSFPRCSPCQVSAIISSPVFVSCLPAWLLTQQSGTLCPFLPLLPSLM